MKTVYTTRSLEKKLTALYMVFAVLLPWWLLGIQLALGMVLLLTLGMMIQAWRQQRSLKIHPFYRFVMIYLGLRFISAVLGPAPWHSLRILVDIEWILICSVLLTSVRLNSEARYRVVQALLVSGTMAGVYGCFQFFSGVNWFQNGLLTPIGNYYRAAGRLGFYLTFAGTQLMILAMALSCWLLKEKWNPGKIFYTIAVLSIAGSIVASFARSAWIAIFVVMLIGGALLYGRRSIKVVAPVLILILLGTLMVPEVKVRVMSIFDASQNEGRITLLKTAWQMVADRPLLGVGPGLFRQMFEKYKVAGFYDSTSHAHNDYLHLAAMSGIPALLAWIAMWGAWFYYMQKAFRNIRLPRRDRFLVLGTMLGVACILVACIFQCYYTDLENNAMWILLIVLGIQIDAEYRSETGMNHSEEYASP